MAPDIAIRRYQPEDAEALYLAASESGTEVYPWLEWCHPNYSRDEAKAWAASRLVLFERGTEFEFVIVDEQGRFLGGCCLNHINEADRMANLGYWVRTSAMGNGVATRAVQLVAQFAFSHTNLERLEIVCEVDNEASQRVAKKAGAVREGILRGRIFLHGYPHDAVLFSILRSEWPVQ
jgi:ribosomal-protein-serine acetyltransferase